MKKVLLCVVFLALLMMLVGAGFAQKRGVNFADHGMCQPKEEDVIGLLVRSIESWMNGEQCSFKAFMSFVGQDRTNVQWLREQTCSHLENMSDENKIVFSSMQIDVDGSSAWAKLKLHVEKKRKVSSKTRRQQEIENGTQIVIQFTKSPHGYWQVEDMRETFSKLYNETNKLKGLNNSGVNHRSLD